MNCSLSVLTIEVKPPLIEYKTEIEIPIISVIYSGIFQKLCINAENIFR